MWPINDLDSEWKDFGSISLLASCGECFANVGFNLLQTWYSDICRTAKYIDQTSSQQITTRSDSDISNFRVLFLYLRIFVCLFCDSGI